VLAFSYWRDFHPDRQLHRVNETVADIVKRRGQARPGRPESSSRTCRPRGSSSTCNRSADWCQTHAGKSRKELILETLRTGQNWYELKSDGHRGLQNKYAEAAGVLLQRMQASPQQRGEIAALVLCVRQPPRSSTQRASGSRTPMTRVRFWGALSLVKQGARDQHEGLQPLQGILDKDDGSLWYPRAFETLLGAGYEEALQSACKILSKERFRPGFRGQCKIDPAGFVPRWTERVPRLSPGAAG